jgi:hypothetical protein
MRTILGAVGGKAGKSLLLLCLSFSTVPPLYSQQGEDLDKYKWRFDAQWWFSRPSGFVEGKGHHGAGGEFDLSKDLHFGSYSTFSGLADWHFKRKHHLIIGLSPVSYSKSETLTRTIDFQGATYNVGERVSVNLRSLSFAPGYQWDFIRRNRGYVALVVQINLLDTDAKITGTAVVNGSVVPTHTESGSFFAPLPVLGPKTRWYLTNSDRLSVEGAFNGMYFGPYGDFYSARATGIVALTHHWRVLAGYQLGSRLSIHGSSSNIGLRLTQKGAVAGIEGDW